MENKMEKRLINNLRFNAVNMVELAGGGHLGMALGIAPTLYVLFSRYMKVVPQNPAHQLRDRFVMSAGHGCSILYSIMNTVGYYISINDLKNFRKEGSLTPGHPSISTPGIDYTSGPLGQGVATAVGMAIAEKMLSEQLNVDNKKLIDNHTFCLVGEGCLMEGISYEALSLAGSLKLNKLIMIYDCNKITKDGDITNVFDTNIVSYVKSVGFHVLEVKDGDNISEIEYAFEQAKKSTDKPVFIIVNTKIGYGTSKENTCQAHSGKLGQDEIKMFKKNLDIYNDPFTLDREIEKQLKLENKRFDIVEKEFNDRIKYYKKFLPDNYKKYEQFCKGEIDVANLLFSFKQDEDCKSTRDFVGDMLRAVASQNSNIVGGSADVSISTKMQLGKHNVADSFRYQEIKYGVREFAMAAISNGLALYGFKPFCVTFLPFADYMKPAIRMSSIMNLNVQYIFTNDGVCSYDDGVAHVPIEHIMELRSIPNLNVYRPCDFNEARACYHNSIKLDGPSALILSTEDCQKVKSDYEGAMKGGYIIRLENKMHLDIILIATGSEVQKAIELARELEFLDRGVRVVSIPSWEVFDKQSKKYKETVLPKGILKMSIEAGTTFGWSHYVDNGVSVGIKNYFDGLESKKCGLSLKELLKVAKELLKK